MFSFIEVAIPWDELDNPFLNLGQIAIAKECVRIEHLAEVLRDEENSG
jgi:hypothetical protein